MIKFRYLSANYYPYESTFRSLKICPFHMTRKMTVSSIVNRGRKIPCRHIEKAVISSFRRESHPSFRNDSFAYDESKINLNVISKWQIIYHFEMRSHSLIPIRWGRDRSRQRDRKKYREPETAPNFVRKICPSGRSAELWCICKSSSIFLLLQIFSSEGVVFFRKNAYIINRIFICEGVIQRERKPWYIRRFVLPSGAFATGCTYLRIGAFLFAPNN